MTRCSIILLYLSAERLLLMTISHCSVSMFANLFYDIFVYLSVHNMSIYYMYIGFSITASVIGIIIGFHFPNYFL